MGFGLVTRHTFIAPLKTKVKKVVKKLPLLTALVVPAILAPILSLTFWSIKTQRGTSKLLICNNELNRL